MNISARLALVVLFHLYFLPAFAQEEVNQVGECVDIRMTTVGDRKYILATNSCKFDVRIVGCVNANMPTLNGNRISCDRELRNEDSGHWHIGRVSRGLFPFIVHPGRETSLAGAWLDKSQAKLLSGSFVACPFNSAGKRVEFDSIEFSAGVYKAKCVVATPVASSPSSRDTVSKCIAIEEMKQPDQNDRIRFVNTCPQEISFNLCLSGGPENLNGCRRWTWKEQDSANYEVGNGSSKLRYELKP